MKIPRTIYQKLFKKRSSDNREKAVSLSTHGSVRGNVLLSYIIDPFLRKEGEAISHDHTHHWESFQIAQILLDKGFAVDVISYENKTFKPLKKYDYFISARTNLERIAQSLNEDCIKVAHLDTAHWLYNNQAAYQRLYALQQRRGITLKKSIRIVEPNWAIEFSNLATILGNQFTIDTYSYSKKPIYRIPISSSSIYPWRADKDFEKARFNYIWFGSSGFVHKGLDLVLEAFAQMPEFNLTVCGPFEQEKEFIRSFQKELYQTSNIRAVGWVDVTSPEFLEICKDCVGLVYPTCAEGGGGSAITCMHASIIPILSYEASVDIDDTGYILKDCSVSEIKNAVQRLSSLDVEELRNLSRSTWELARRRHTKDIFKREYDKFITEVLLTK